MGIKKMYAYDYDDGKNAADMALEILNDPERESITDIIIGSWGAPYEEDCQPVIDMFVENSDKFGHVQSLFVGDMESEECEMSWILQGHYEKLLHSMKYLKQLTIQGSSDLKLGTIDHENLEELEIRCGGLSKTVIQDLSKSKLPKLKKLNLFLGSDWYGFDADIDDIKTLLKNPDFENLTYLGLGNSVIQNDVVEAVFETDIVSKVETLDFSLGTLSDRGAKIILDNMDRMSQLKKMNLYYNFISDEYAKKLEALPLKVNLDYRMESDGEGEDYPMITE